MKITIEKSLWQALNSEFAESRITILNWLIDQMRSKPYIKVSIKYIADSLRLHERTVQKALAEFVSFGFITKEQLYGSYCHNTIRLNRKIFQFAKYLKYKFESMWRYLFFVYLEPREKSATPYIEEDVIKFNNNTVNSRLSVNVSPRVNRMSTVSDQLASIFNKITQKPKFDTQEWQDIGNGLVRNRKGIVKCIEDVT